MGDYITKTFVIFFFVAMGLSLVTNMDGGLFNTYFEEQVNLPGDTWFDIIRNSFLSFEAATGAVVLGALFLGSGASAPLVIAMAMLGSVMGMLLDALNIINIVSLPLPATYVVSGLFIIMLISMVIRFARGT